MRNPLSVNWMSWLLLVLNLFSAFYISQLEDYKLWFILLLSFNIILGLVFAKRINTAVLNIYRILVGLLFIYSGLVKGVDPLGTQFRIEDYFYAYETIWALPMSLSLSVFLNAFEFTIGALILTKIKARWVNILALLMMVFFTITTINDALNNPVPDCGCFGDALIISNWQTLYKNLVINALVIVLALRAADFKVGMAAKSQFIVFLTIVLSFLGFEYYNIQHLPVVDFRPWKVGNHLLPENPKPIKYYLTYKNTKTGETKEYLSKDLPWQDSVFMADWKWLNSREEDPNFQEKRTFPMVDNEGNDWSNDIVQYDGGVLLISIYDIQKISQEQADKIKVLYQDALKAELNIIMLNSNTTDVYNEFSERFGLPDMDVYNSDDTALKAAIRSNPGLIVVKNAKVIAKYHINDFPNIEEIKTILK